MFVIVIKFSTTNIKTWVTAYVKYNFKIKYNKVLLKHLKFE